MKKIFAILLCVLLVFTLASCKDKNDVGQVAVDTFEDNVDKSVQEIADAIAEESDVELLTAMVSEGIFDGFGNVPIAGFESAMLITPADTSIPFVSYVFDLPEDADKNTFIGTLEKYADVGFKGEEKADKVIIKDEGDKVIVVITPEKIETDLADSELAEEQMVVDGEEFIEFDDDVEFEEFE